MLNRTERGSAGSALTPERGDMVDPALPRSVLLFPGRRIEARHRGDSATRSGVGFRSSSYSKVLISRRRAHEKHSSLHLIGLSRHARRA